MFGQILPLIGEIGKNLIKQKPIREWIEMAMHTGLYPVLQAIGIVYLKKTKDPLEGISKLDCLQIVSINQKITKNFLPNILASQRWCELDSDTQHHLMKLCGTKIEDKENHLRSKEYQTKQKQFFDLLNVSLPELFY